MAPARGAFIVFEGIDRCGKSTQSLKLVEHLQRNNVRLLLLLQLCCWGGPLGVWRRCEAADKVEAPPTRSSPPQPHSHADGCAQTPVELWRFPDRTCSATGATINAYLAKEVDLCDEAVHLLFSANRWEKRRVHPQVLWACATLRREHAGGWLFQGPPRACSALSWPPQG